MTYRVEFTTAAARQVKKLPPQARTRVIEAAKRLQNDPRPHGAKKITGEKTAWRIRVGEYRLIYSVANHELVVLVVRVAHRRQAYR